jgi:hypothetical protein
VCGEGNPHGERSPSHKYSGENGLLTVGQAIPLNEKELLLPEKHHNPDQESEIEQGEEDCL